MSWNTPTKTIFPRWADDAAKIAGLLAVLGGGYVTMLIAYGFSPKTTDVGYAPVQPIPYSHALHVGELGMDCRYCHTSVEDSAKANLPPTATCWNCHSTIKTESPKLEPLRQSYETGNPIPWIRVHDLPDYVFFDHSAHVTRGVGCVSCHGRVDTMDVVYQVEPLSMSWCLDCHRYPERALRPAETATDMTWVPRDDAGNELDRVDHGIAFKAKHGINPPTDCSTCHR